MRSAAPPDRGARLWPVVQKFHALNSFPASSWLRDRRASSPEPFPLVARAARGRLRMADHEVVPGFEGKQKFMASADLVSGRELNVLVEFLRSLN